MGDVGDDFRALRDVRRKYRDTLRTCPECRQRNPGGATKMHKDNGVWSCHYCGHTEEAEKSPSQSPQEPTFEQNGKLMFILSELAEGSRHQSSGLLCEQVFQAAEKIKALVWRWKR